MRLERIIEYFPELNDQQRQAFEQLYPLYSEWNAQINVISRKDMEHFYERHVLHSLSIAKLIQFTPGSTILDVGTGGGFPGIPLSIYFPEVKFHLVDSIGKKIKVVQEVSNALGLKNIEATHARAEQLKGKYDFVVSRAVTRLIDFYPWVSNKISNMQRNAMDNGILYLKGIDLTEEFDELHKPYQLFSLAEFYTEEFFVSKGIIHIPIF